MSEQAPNPTGRRLRIAAHVALLLTVVATATGLAAQTHRTAAVRSLPPLVPPVPGTGQQTNTNVLPSGDRDFTSSAAGWTGVGGHVSWVSSRGHDALGALQVSATALLGGAMSPTFSVTPGARYSASAWVTSNAAKASAAPVLLFYDGSGNVITASNQIGQYVPDTGAWIQTLPVVGFAPSNARTARVGVVTARKRMVHYVDDVTVSETSGTATRVLGPLRTQGTQILDVTGQPVILRGVEVVGLASQPQRSVSDLLNEVAVAHQWGANEIRVPLNEDRLVVGSCSYDSSYLNDIRQVVTYATAAGMLVDLDLENFAVTPCGRITLPPMPDQRAITFWQTLASTFSTNPLVAFDLFNEPHDISAKIWHDGGQVDYNGNVYVSVGIQKLYDTVRSTGAQNLVFVSGVHWATDFPYSAPLTGVSNVVYAPHIYTCPSGLPSKKVQCWTVGPNGITDPRTMMNRFSRLGRSYPLVVTEFGWPDARDGRYIRNVIDEVQRRGWDGWTVFAFDGTTSGMFDLVKNVGSVEDPTQSGMAAMVGLSHNS